MLAMPKLVKRFTTVFGVAFVVLLFFHYDLIRHTDPPIIEDLDEPGLPQTQPPSEEQPGPTHVVVPVEDVRLPTGGFKITEDVEKKQAVVEAFKHAWAAYERDAMGYDEYHPISKKGTNFDKEGGGIGYMIIDALDTIQIMGLEDEYKRARQWIAKFLSFDRDENFNLFETTIRVLGGLLSAYHLSKNDTLYLDKAIDLADRLLPAFDTSSGIPQAMINLGQRVGVFDHGNGGLVSTAEATTLQLEFRYLSYISENYTYWNKAEEVMKIVRKSNMPLGLAPIFLDPKEGKFKLSEIRLGSRGDSFYEYLLKQYIQTNQTEPVYRKMYDRTMEAMHKHLITKSLTRGLTHTIELLPNYRPNEEPWKVSPKQDHLVCFLGGSLMLGTRFRGSDMNNVRDWQTGKGMVEGCMATHETATGLSPEIAYWRVEGDTLEDLYPHDWYIKGSVGTARGGSRIAMTPYDARYILRPETVESLFLAYRLTGDEKYRKWGWGIFQSIQKYCRLESGGYASILNVDDTKSGKSDKMETFFLAETLKYLYLLFSNDTVIPLDEYVFNTEAHPFPIFTPPPERLWAEP